MATKSNGHKSNGHHVKEKIRKIYKYDKKQITAAARSVTKVAKQAKEKFSEVEESVEIYAKHNPWKTIGMSVLAGVLVGKIMQK